MSRGDPEVKSPLAHEHAGHWVALEFVEALPFQRGDVTGTHRIFRCPGCGIDIRLEIPDRPAPRS